MKEVRLRFAPSPTGYLHIGGLRTILYNYLYVRKNGGSLILRIEDTDQERLVEDAIENLIESINWSGLTYDEGVYLEDGQIVERGDYGPYIQSKRLETYKKYVDQLLDSGHAYYCFCSKERLDNLREEQKIRGQVPKYDGLCRGISREDAEKRIANGEKPVVRLKMPEDYNIEFDDLVRGHISFNSNDQDDQVLLKSDGFPTYHMAVVVDDHLMDITHIVRGEEWISSTPKHIYTYECLGWDVPEFVHLPTVLNKNRKKLSKREGDVSVEDFKRSGYLPQGLINYLALVGWSPPDNKEIMDLDEMVDKFSFDRVSSSGGVFDIDKLNWVNSHYVKKLSGQDLYELSKPFMIDSNIVDEKFLEDNEDWMIFLLETVQDSIDNFAQVPEAISFAFELYPDDLDDKAKEMLGTEDSKRLLDAIEDKLRSIDDLDEENASTFMKEIQKETGIKGKNLFMPARIAMTGKNHGPELSNIMILLGKDKLLENLDKAKQYTI